MQAFKVTPDLDTMYLHETMKEPDWKEFITSMVNEVTYQMDNESYSIIPKSQVPNGVTILPEVWKLSASNTEIRGI